METQPAWEWLSGHLVRLRHQPGLPREYGRLLQDLNSFIVFADTAAVRALGEAVAEAATRVLLEDSAHLRGRIAEIRTVSERQAGRPALRPAPASPPDPTAPAEVEQLERWWKLPAPRRRPRR